jgi:hypothetical protein
LKSLTKRIAARQFRRNLTDSTQYHTRKESRQDVSRGRYEDAVALFEEEAKGKGYPPERDQGQNHKPNRHDSVWIPARGSRREIRPILLPM